MKYSYLFLGGIFILFISATGYGQKSREEIPEKYKWDLNQIYSSEQEWESELIEFSTKINEMEKFKGTLTQSSENLLKTLEYDTYLTVEIIKIHSYARLNSDLDKRNMKFTGMNQEVQNLWTELETKSAYLIPELLACDWEKIDGFIKSEPKLEDYRMFLENIFHKKTHSLSESEEKIMALSYTISHTPAYIFGAFSNAEMPKPEVTLSDGKKIEVGSAEYSEYRASANRKDREIVFEAYWNNYAKFRASFGEMLYGNVKSDMFRAKARNYGSSMEAALYPSNIPVEIYHSLVDNVNKSLPAFHRYLSLKKRMMGVDTLKYLDLYAPAVKDVELRYSYDDASKIILEAMKPLGDEYVSTVKKAIDERWIDVYPTPGKRTGAYSNGAHYHGHPYILLNYNDHYSAVSTMAHEIGHTMHSYFSNKTQPQPKAGYVTFVAEVASTFNEVLLFNHVLSTVNDDDVKLSILMNWLDGFKGTLFRQTQFAEFELKIHEVAEQGKPLTGETFSKIYKDIVNKYYGHDQGVCHIDDYISMEWAYIPHFYRSFYVFQYSTSFTASISLAEKVMSGDKQALKNYIDFLSSGGSDYPVELLKKAGVDMTANEPFKLTMASMNKVMDEIEKILDKKKK